MIGDVSLPFVTARLPPTTARLWAIQADTTTQSALKVHQRQYCHNATNDHRKPDSIGDVSLAFVTTPIPPLLGFGLSKQTPQYITIKSSPMTILLQCNK